MVRVWPQSLPRRGERTRGKLPSVGRGASSCRITKMLPHASSWGGTSPTKQTGGDAPLSRLAQPWLEGPNPAPLVLPRWAGALRGPRPQHLPRLLPPLSPGCRPRRCLLLKRGSRPGPPGRAPRGNGPAPRLPSPRPASQPARARPGAPGAVERALGAEAASGTAHPAGSPCPAPRYMPQPCRKCKTAACAKLISTGLTMSSRL